MKLINPTASQVAMDAVTAGMTSITPVMQTAVPLTGTTVVMTDDNADGVLYIKPAGALLALTITFPSDANSRLGQIRRICFSQAITTLTLGGATILNTVGSAIANDCISFQKIEANKWVLI